MPVQRDCRAVPDLRQLGLDILLLLFQLPVLEQRLVSRVNHHHAIEAIEQNVIARSHAVAGVFQADHRRDTQRAGHDGCVRGFSADIRGEALHQIAIELGGLGGGKIVPHQNERLGEVTEILLPAAGEVGHHARGHVADIGGAFAEKFILHRVEGLHVFFRHLVKGKLHVH